MKRVNVMNKHTIIDKSTGEKNAAALNAAAAVSWIRSTPSK